MSSDKGTLPLGQANKRARSHPHRMPFTSPFTLLTERKRMNSRSPAATVGRAGEARRGAFVAAAGAPGVPRPRCRRQVPGRCRPEGRVSGARRGPGTPGTRTSPNRHVNGETPGWDFPAERLSDPSAQPARGWTAGPISALTVHSAGESGLACRAGGTGGAAREGRGRGAVAAVAVGAGRATGTAETADAAVAPNAVGTVPSGQAKDAEAGGRNRPGRRVGVRNSSRLGRTRCEGHRIRCLRGRRGPPSQSHRDSGCR